MKRAATDAPLPEEVRQRLANLRSALLRLHKVLLDDERAAYERAYGRVSGGEMLQLVIHDERFSWLHSISELIVGIDEMLDADEPTTTDDAEQLFAQARLLLRPSETGSEFEHRYYDALQREPDAVLAHSEVTKILKADT